MQRPTPCTKDARVDGTDEPRRVRIEGAGGYERMRGPPKAPGIAKNATGVSRVGVPGANPAPDVRRYGVRPGENRLGELGGRDSG